MRISFYAVSLGLSLCALLGQPAVLHAESPSSSPLILKSLGSEATWVTTSWSACSLSCGTGTQTRTATCQLSDGTPVDDSLCVQTAPALTQSCTDFTSCSYNWAPAAWDPTCSATCGYGTQSRNVWCQRSNGDFVLDGLCTGTRPETTQTCSAYSACAYTWRIDSGWGGCSGAPCTTGVQTRSVNCYREDNTRVADSYCPAASKPATSQACSVPCLPCLFDGNTIAHGAGIPAFISSEATYPNTCDTELRVCNNGTLSGSSGNESCTIRFYSSGTITMPPGTSFVAYRLIGGGGGGGGGIGRPDGNSNSQWAGAGGGGGGGGYTVGSTYVSAGTPISVTVGAGGAGGVGVSPSGWAGSGGSGGHSVITINGSSAAAYGGTGGHGAFGYCCGGDPGGNVGGAGGYGNAAYGGNGGNGARGGSGPSAAPHVGPTGATGTNAGAAGADVWWGHTGGGGGGGVAGGGYGGRGGDAASGYGSPGYLGGGGGGGAGSQSMWARGGNGAAGGNGYGELTVR